MTATGAGVRGRRVHQHGQAFDARGPADGGGHWAPHLRDQPVVTAACHHGALGTELGGDEFEGGVAVVVEAADDARVFDKGTRNRIRWSCSFS